MTLKQALEKLNLAVVIDSNLRYKMGGQIATRARELGFEYYKVIEDGFEVNDYPEKFLPFIREILFQDNQKRRSE